MGQEVHEIHPSSVHENSGTLGVDYNELFVHGLGAIACLNNKIDDLERIVSEHVQGKLIEKLLKKCK